MCRPTKQSQKVNHVYVITCIKLKHLCSNELPFQSMPISLSAWVLHHKISDKKVN